MDKSMALRPRLSEKAYAQTQAQNTYVFNVPLTANKMTVADAVKAQFEVTVEDVRIVLVKGKVKQSYRKGRRPVSGKRADVKKAYIRLQAGQTINIFGDPDKDAKKDKVTEALQKQVQKAAQPEVKQKRGLRSALGRGSRQTQNKGGDK